MEGVSYPVNQQTYLPDQSYTIQQYPPQLPGYVQSQQPGYPPQVSGYSPAAATVPITYPVGGYKADVPPPYYAHQQALPQQQQSSTNVVVVQQQPTAVYTRTIVNASGDNFLTLSVVLTILCFLCGSWYLLLCTVPAIVFASAAKEAERQGDLAAARQKRNGALICNVTACVWWVMITLILIVVPIAVIATRSSDYNHNYYHNDYYYNYNYYDYNYYYDYDEYNYYNDYYSCYYCYK